MITQTIKYWLYKLFAWWPRKRAPESDYAQAVTNVNASTAQDAVWRVTMEGPLPQPGIMSVAVEQEKDDPVSETGQSKPNDRPERLVQPAPPGATESTETARISSAETSHEATTPPGNAPSPTFEQQLAFLHYLVKRGIINEGFAEGQVPKQYKRKL